MKNNLFSYTDSNKRYHTLDYFYKHKFDSKVFKVSLNAGFTCPNIDGTCGTGGCIYCSHLGSGDFAGDKNEDLLTQFSKVKDLMHQKWPDALYIGYFQAHTNTYAPVSVLKEKYEKIVKQDNVIGLSIATRADSISEECLQYLEELSKRTYLTVELGLQTIHEKTSVYINRCHTLECFEETVKRLREKHIHVVVHIMNGLPFETKEMMLDTVRYLNMLDIQGIKIHMLHVLTSTALALDYKKEPFPILTKEEYVDIVCDQLELLRPEIVIHRITGDPKKEDLIAPTWLLKKFDVLNSIDKELARRNTYQGFLLKHQNYLWKVIQENLKDRDLVCLQVQQPSKRLVISSMLPNVVVFQPLTLLNDTIYQKVCHKFKFIYFEDATLLLEHFDFWKDLLNPKGIILLSSDDPLPKMDLQEIVIQDHYYYIHKKN